MALSIQEVSDRLEIQDLLYSYADIIDTRRFDELRTVFTDDAHIDYSVTGGAVGNLEEIIVFLKEAFMHFSASQHLNANMQIKIDGDEATGRVMCFNPMDMKLAENNHLFMVGIWYVDKYVRTSAGWRMKERVEEKSWEFNMPEFMTGSGSI